MNSSINFNGFVDLATAPNTKIIPSREREQLLYKNPALESHTYAATQKEQEYDEYVLGGMFMAGS